MVYHGSDLSYDFGRVVALGMYKHWTVVIFPELSVSFLFEIQPDILELCVYHLMFHSDTQFFFFEYFNDFFLRASRMLGLPLTLTTANHCDIIPLVNI